MYCTDKLSKSNPFVNRSNINAARADSNAAMMNMFKYIKISLALFSTHYDYTLDKNSYIKRRRYDVAEQL